MGRSRVKAVVKQCSNSGRVKQWSNFGRSAGGLRPTATPACTSAPPAAESLSPPASSPLLPFRTLLRPPASSSTCSSFLHLPFYFSPSAAARGRGVGNARGGPGRGGARGSTYQLLGCGGQGGPGGLVILYKLPRLGGPVMARGELLHPAAHKRAQERGRQTDARAGNARMGGRAWRTAESAACDSNERRAEWKE